MPTDTPDVAAQVRQALAKMTPGPWRMWGPFPHAGIYAGESEPPDCLAMGTLPCKKDIAEDHDIAGIVLLRNTAEILVSELERLRKQIDVIDGEVLAYGADGCLTGDCPHETQAECDAALAKSYADFVGDLRTILDAKELSDEWISAKAKLEQENAQLRQQLTAARDALRAMIVTHGAHGPCRQNGCSDCRWAYDKARAALGGEQ